MVLPIKGFQTTTLIDYPGRIASIVFIGGCNLNCGFCYNVDLISGHEKTKNIDPKEILLNVKERKGYIDGVVITGGEPLMYPEIVGFVKDLKARGLCVKIDTNGTNPELLKEIIELVDYVAMDIKGVLDKYSVIAGVECDINEIKKSIEILKNSSVEYEFRMTVLPKYHSLDDMKEISKMLQGSKKFAIQQFRNDVKLLDMSLHKEKQYSKEELEGFKKILEKDIEIVEIRV